MKQKKLHIVYLDLDDRKNPLLAAGQATATYEVGTRLVKKGNKVTVICSNYPNAKDRFDAGIYYKHIGIGTNNIKINNLIYIFVLPFYVKKIKADIIIECFTAPISTLLSPLWTKVPVVALPSMFNAEEFSRKYHLPLYLIERYGAKLYKYIMPYSDVDSKKIRQLNPTITYRIIPQGISSQYLHLRKRKPEFILFLGRFDNSQKGIDLLIEAYAKVVHKTKYPLVIAGHGPDEGKIRKLISKFHMEKRIKVVGPLYGKEKMEMMSKALFVAFSSRHDELSLWALEALGAGLPLVCFDLPEYKWMGQHAVLRAKAFSIKDYGKLMIEATNEKINKEMSIAARKLARKYSWDTVVNKFESFFQEIITGTL